MGPRVPDADLCVVIVSYGTPAMTIECLGALVPHVRALGASVALVDQASPGDSVARLERWIREHGAEDHVKLIASTITSVGDYGSNTSSMQPGVLPWRRLEQ